MENLPVKSGDEQNATTPCPATDPKAVLDQGQASAQSVDEATQEVPTENVTDPEVTTTQTAPANMPAGSAPAPVDTEGPQESLSLPANTQNPSGHFTNPMLFSVPELLAARQRARPNRVRQFRRPSMRRRSQGQQATQPGPGPTTQSSPVQGPFPTAGYLVGPMPNGTMAFHRPAAAGPAVMAQPWTPTYVPIHSYQMGALVGGSGCVYPQQVLQMVQAGGRVEVYDSKFLETFQAVNEKIRVLRGLIARENARLFRLTVARQNQENIRSRILNLVVHSGRESETSYRMQTEDNGPADNTAQAAHDGTVLVYDGTVLVEQVGVDPAFTPGNASANDNMEQERETTQSEDGETTMEDDLLMSEAPVTLRRCKSAFF